MAAKCVQAEGGRHAGFCHPFAATAIYLGAHDVALAQATTPNVTPPFQGLSTPVTSTVTNCMMSCNSQLANCQTACLIPAPPALAGTFAGQQLARSVTLNSTSTAACSIGCTSNQLACH